MVARRLQDAGFGTLLFDLLTVREEALDAITRRLRFDIEFLADATGRGHGVAPVTTGDADHAPRILRREHGRGGGTRGGGPATGTGERCRSRGGRPDLAGPLLREVTAPTLLIVGGADGTVIRLNQVALAQLASDRRSW